MRDDEDGGVAACSCRDLPAIERPMQFASDNWAGAAPEIVAAVAAEAERADVAYGGGQADGEAAARFNDLFEREVAVFYVATGSAANGLAMTAINRPGGVIFCHRDAHIIEGETGGVEYLTGGARLFGLDGPTGRIEPASLERAVASVMPPSEHHGQAMAISITQQTEAGTIYAPAEIRAISALARAKGLPLHMDGARFANAVARTGATPAELTWKAGVDILSFGATKNGCIAAEAVVFFDPAMARDMPILRKRAGQLFSKARFAAAQFDAYLTDGLWLRLAARANSMADRLRTGLQPSPKARLAWETTGNEIFVIMPAADPRRLADAGVHFHEWTRTSDVTLAPGETLVRLVTSFATREAEVDDFLKLLG